MEGPNRLPDRVDAALLARAARALRADGAPTSRPRSSLHSESQGRCLSKARSEKKGRKGGREKSGEFRRGTAREGAARRGARTAGASLHSGVRALHRPRSGKRENTETPSTSTFSSPSLFPFRALRGSIAGAGRACVESAGRRTKSGSGARTWAPHREIPARVGAEGKKGGVGMVVGQGKKSDGRTPVAWRPLAARTPTHSPGRRDIQPQGKNRRNAAKRANTAPRRTVHRPPFPIFTPTRPRRDLSPLPGKYEEGKDGRAGRTREKPGDSSTSPPHTPANPRNPPRRTRPSAKPVPESRVGAARARGRGVARAGPGHGRRLRRGCLLYVMSVRR